MCDQTEVSYLPDDIVWVKLGSVWWPAQVQDESKLDEEVTSGLRKKPLAIVKFFDEDSYEFPKNLDQIYHYNCLKKDEFIKKGLDQCRPSGYKEISSNMKKFPQDVMTAEKLTGGNPDIINDPKYLPEEKYDYREEFGLKPRKKSSQVNLKRSSTDSITETPKQARVRFSTPIFSSEPSTSKKSSTTRPINVVRPYSSSLVKKLKVKEKTKITVKKEEVKDEKRKNTIFKCFCCSFHCTRVGVIVEHYRAHYMGMIFPSPTFIPERYYKIFQENYLKHSKNNSSSANSTPVSMPKGGSDKVTAKRKLVPESSPTTKKRKSTPAKSAETPHKEKKSSTPGPSKVVQTPGPSGVVPTPGPSRVASTPKSSTAASTPGPSRVISTPGSSRVVPTKDIVGSKFTSKKRQRKQKEAKPSTSKQAEALDILKDWDDDDEEENDLSVTEVEIKNASSNEEPSVTPEKQKSPSKEKSCFDFEDTDDSISLDKSLKFGQKLPRVITEEKPSVRLLKELKESKDESPIDEDLTNKVDNLLKQTELPKLPEIPSCSQSNENNKAIGSTENNILLDNTEKKDISQNQLFREKIESDLKGTESQSFVSPKEVANKLKKDGHLLKMGTADDKSENYQQSKISQISVSVTDNTNIKDLKIEDVSIEISKTDSKKEQVEQNSAVYQTKKVTEKDVKKKKI